MANRDFKKIERIMKDFSLNLGGGDAPSQLVFGTLTETEEFIDINLVLKSSLAYSDIVDYFNDGKTVILQYAEILPGEEEVSNYYYYAIYNADLFEGKYIFDGTPFKRNQGSGGSIGWDFEKETFYYNGGLA